MGADSLILFSLKKTITVFIHFLWRARSSKRPSFWNIKADQVTCLVHKS